MIEKTADEMFNELGYSKFLYFVGDRYMAYRNDEKFIVFDLVKKEYEAETVSRKSCSITTEEHKAITKKMEELGWL